MSADIVHTRGTTFEDQVAVRVLGIVLDRMFPGTTIERVLDDEGRILWSLAEPTGYLNFLIVQQEDEWATENFGSYPIPVITKHTVSGLAHALTDCLEKRWQETWNVLLQTQSQLKALAA